MTGAIAFTLASFKLLADSTLRVTCDVEPRDAKAFLALFQERGDAGAMARLNPEFVDNGIPELDKKSNPAKYGQHANILRQSGFFRMPEVWKAVGTDEEYQTWCRSQKCVVCGGADYVEETGEMLCEYAHVLRAHLPPSREGKNPNKPAYSGVPMCHSDHMTQHNPGELAVLVGAGKAMSHWSKVEAKEWFDEKKIKYLEQWAWGTLKAELQYEHWNEVPPEVLYEWANDHGLAQYLPGLYREAG